MPERIPLQVADVVVIGGGPAGLAAAVEASRAGTGVVLVDAAARLGGQFWRHGARDEAPGAPAPRRHHGWATYLELSGGVAQAAAAGRLEHLAQTQVWALDRDPDGLFSVRLARTPESGRGPEQARTVRARTVVLCPGAYDRQLPVPGWDLPGVMAAGGIQAFIKVNDRTPGKRVLLAGTGPFLLAAAACLVEAGSEVVAICESSTLRRWVPGGATAAFVPSKAVEGAQYVSVLARHRVPYLTSHVVTDIHGPDRVSGVTVARADAAGCPDASTARRFDGVDLVGLGWGFVPQAELLVQVGGRTRIDTDGSLVGEVDEVQESTVPALYLAGEITGVKGAIGAVAEGRIAGRAARAAVGGGRLRPRGRRADVLARGRHRLFAQAMHRAHPVPSAWISWLTPETTVCRCEEVRLRDVTEGRDRLFAHDPRSLKGVTRAGMGLCQGRMCGAACEALAGAVDGASPDPGQALAAGVDVQRRPVVAPLTLSVLAREDPS